MADGGISGSAASSYYQLYVAGQEYTHNVLRVVIPDPIDLSNFSKCTYSIDMYGYKVDEDKNQWFVGSIGFTSNPNFTYSGTSYLSNGSFIGYGGEDAGKSFRSSTSNTVIPYSGTIDLSNLDPDNPYYLTMLIYRCTYSPGSPYSSDRYAWMRLYDLTLTN